MSIRQNTAILTGFVLSISLFTATLTALLSAGYYNRVHFQELGAVCQGIIEQNPETEPAVASALKGYTDNPAPLDDGNFLLSYGYEPAYFLHSAAAHTIIFVTAGFLSGGILFLITLLSQKKKEITFIKALTDYLEKVNAGKSTVLFPAGEDEYSKLQDQIYKMVTELRQARDEALKARNHFAENLYNIAHQIKTPITAISLSVQMMRSNPSSNHLEQIQQQLSRLTHLEESLLLLPRIDAAALTFEKKYIDVYTVLMLAADNLQELFSRAGVSCQIKYSDSDEIEIYADLDWTMEAVINLLKNCMEHTPPGQTVYCSYEQNPLYTQIQIWDTGSGFAKEDIPHLFERYYQGQNARNGGIGIGLALAKAIIENQNGTITAYNLVNAGACFEIHFYRSSVSH